MAQFSDTTNKNGLIQLYEFWTRQPDGTVSGDSTLLKLATAQINSAFERIIPILLAYNDQLRWDDQNNTDKPVGKMNLVSGQSDYKVTTDGNSYDILNLTGVRILQSSTDTTYYPLERITADDPLAKNAISPDTTNEVGIPQYFLELGNVLYLYPNPNYSATSGIELFFGRQQQYFTSSDTTKEPGIPLPFHELLALYAALAWNSVNRTSDTALLQLLQAQINKRENDLRDFINLRNPTKVLLSTLEEEYE